MFARPFHYPPDFVQRVVDALPEEPGIKELLDAGCGYSVRLRLKGNKRLVQQWNRIYKKQRSNITDSFLVM